MTDANEPQSGRNDPKWEREVLEKLVLGTLAEQRAARRWRIFFRVVTLVVIVWALSSGLRSAHMATTLESPTTEHTALVTIDGEIDSRGRNSADRVIEALDDAFDNKFAKGVVLLINSPGGSPVQAGMVADEIKRLRGLHPDKPVHVVVQEMCASGGYYIAAAAENIYVDKASLVGSIGVIMDSFGAVELLKKLGVERRVYTAGENKDFLDPFTPVNDKQREHIQSILDTVHRQFIGVVREGRGQRLKETPDMFSGLVWNGEQAVELGLADGYGTVNTVARDVFKAEDVIDYTVQESPFDRITKRLGAEMGTVIGQVLARTTAGSGQPGWR
ncbi:S49 family peptidase [Derxia gummosa]|uniref:S49 family peptidase n=1 Tax=Derxia gummosa DSM 723 TaxID=1121388 RepID=A0A8B6X6N6_9BURK|nr:S49 family peptidase [Derxia gummosa]